MYPFGCQMSRKEGSCKAESAGMPRGRREWPSPSGQLAVLSQPWEEQGGSYSLQHYGGRYWQAASPALFPEHSISLSFVA